MNIIPSSVLRMLEHLRATQKVDMLHEQLAPSGDTAGPKPLRPVRRANQASIASLWQRLKTDAHATDAEQQVLADPQSIADAEDYSRNIENLIGTVKVPVGVIGPLRINGLNAHGDFFVPLATTEAALVASYGRGARLISDAGGASAALVSDGVLRTPGFAFDNLVDAGLFVDWVARSTDELKAAAEATTRHGKLISLEPVVDNDTAFLLCRYTTGDASGQNMVTIATEAMCRHIEAHTPVKPKHWFIEANFSGDKKASYLGLLTGRGRKVSASVLVPDDLIRRQLRTDPERMLDYAKMANLGALLSGQFGAQAHYANALAALYIATGQDAACVSESAVGFTRMERRGEALFISVTLPNILVGSVGGGTGLPSQNASLRMMGLAGEGKAPALAEIAAVLCLCGEISIIGAIAAGHFTSAHQKLARQR